MPTLSTTNFGAFRLGKKLMVAYGARKCDREMLGFAKQHLIFRRRRNNSRAAAFTLIELLVVVAVVGLLASLLLPVLGKAKAKAQATLCLNNHRQLALALRLYTDDHDDALPFNLGADGTRATVAAKQYLNWVNNVMTWELDSDNTNSFLLTAGGIGMYCSGAPDLFKCPADTALSAIQRRAGWSHRVRSVSLNAMLGNPGEFLAGNINTNNPRYRQFFKAGDIRAPSMIFTFIDEHPDSINDGYFINRLVTPEWIDLPASQHNGAAVLSFADGHSEAHRWIYARTRPPARPDAALLPMPIPESERADYDWLRSRMSTSDFGSSSEKTPYKH